MDPGACGWIPRRLGDEPALQPSPAAFSLSMMKPIGTRRDVTLEEPDLVDACITLGGLDPDRFDAGEAGDPSRNTILGTDGLARLYRERFRSPGFLVAALAALWGHGALGSEATVIVSAAVQNGSFEEEPFAPWSGGERIPAPAEAPDGIAIARTVAATVSRADLFRSFPAVANDRRTVLLTFKARVDVGGFQTVTAAFFGRRQDGSFLHAAPNGLDARRSVSDGWESYRYLFQFPEAWDLTQHMQISFLFNNGKKGDRGYLDKVMLVQLPTLPNGEKMLLVPVGEEIVILFEGTLQMSDDLSDAQGWADVDPVPSSPWLVPHDWRIRFFRVRMVP